MPLLSIVFGALLDLLGAYGFVSTGGTHYTSLIPSAFGTLLILCGLLALALPSARKHFMHAAATVGLLGTLGGLGMGLPKLSALLAGAAARPSAVVLQILMGVISLVFVALCVRSFILARRAKPVS
ncbi:MAG TPA: hypothetical protein VIS74_03825 [Chthoniobacterales bacterium]